MKSQRLAWWPVVLALLLGAWALSSLAPGTEKEFHVREFGRLPVLSNGREQPFDSIARNSLLQLRGKQTAPIKLHFSIWNEAKRGRSMSAMEWLLELMTRPEIGDTRKVFRVDHPELVALLKLPAPDEDRGEDGKHFSFSQIQGGLGELEREARRASEKEGAQRTAFERGALQLYNGVILYRRLKNSLMPEGTDNFAADVEAYAKAIPAGMAAVEAREAKQAFSQEDFDKLLGFLHRYEPLTRMAVPLVVPPTEGAKSPDAWENLGTGLMLSARLGQVPPAVRAYAAMATAYRQTNVVEFNRQLAEFRASLEPRYAQAVSKARAETLYNQFQPFYRALVLDVLAFLMVCGFWFTLRPDLRRAAVWLTAVGWAIHTSGLLYRMLLEGRPPVTNLYSSAIFIGWGCVLLGLLLERLHRLGLGVAMASLVGFVTLIIAHNLAIGGDTMEMMRAVLDSNFWLATHVVTITIGYSANFAAGVLGVFFVVLGLFSRVLTEESIKAVHRLIYGIICFATLLSFVGTILGGIWADQSWGRFWGWDPKENGALIIVLWNALILHLRWAGAVKERGMAALAIFGNVVTSFSWFGVNMLGVGLHAYGFMDAAFKWLILFIVSQLILIGLSLIPLERWRSFRSMPRTA